MVTQFLVSSNLGNLVLLFITLTQTSAWWLRSLVLREHFILHIVVVVLDPAPEAICKAHSCPYGISSILRLDPEIECNDPEEVIEQSIQKNDIQAKHKQIRVFISTGSKVDQLY